MGITFNEILNHDSYISSQTLDSFADPNISGMNVGVTPASSTNISPAHLSDHSPIFDLYQYNNYPSQSSLSYTNQQHMQTPSAIKKSSSPPTQVVSSSRSHSSSSSAHSTSPKSPAANSDDPLAPVSSAIKKRTLNTLAARRYRQRRVDQVSNLEEVLKETRDERDSLKEKVARLEGELDVLRRLVGKK